MATAVQHHCNKHGRGVHGDGLLVHTGRPRRVHRDLAEQEGVLLRRTAPASLWRPRVLVSPVPHGSRTTPNRGAQSVEVKAGVWKWFRMESRVDRRRRKVAVSAWRRRMEPAEDRCRWRRLGDGTRRRCLPCPVRAVGIGRGNVVPAGGMVGVPQGQEIPHVALFRSGHEIGPEVDVGDGSA